MVYKLSKYNTLVIAQSIKIGGGAERFATYIASLLNETPTLNVLLITYRKEEKEYSCNCDRISFNKKLVYNDNNYIIKKLKKLIEIIDIFLIRPLKIKGICKKHKIEKIIVVGSLAYLSVIVCKKIFSIHPKIIFRVTNNYEKEYKKREFKNLLDYIILYWLIVKIFAKKADLIIAPSKGVSESILKNIQISKKLVKTIYNLHPIDSYIKKSKKPLNKKYLGIFDEKSYLFITVGRIDSQKGHYFLLRSFKLVVNENSNTKLIIIGEGPLRSKLYELISELNLGNKVFLLGNQDNIFPFIKKANCFVFSSIWEGLPNVIIEALSTNIPIISTDCKYGPREILCPNIDLSEKLSYPYYGQFGVLTKPFEKNNQISYYNKFSEEEKMLSRIMLEFTRNKSLNEQYSSGLARAKDFDIDKIKRNWENILQNI